MYWNGFLSWNKVCVHIQRNWIPFTHEELDSVLRKIKNRKAAGLDEIPPEVWKTRKFDDILLRHCNAVYNQNPIDRWMKGCILPFPKKGNLGLAKNCRGITLTSIAAKIYNALLRNCIEPKIENILWKNQNSFRRNRSTTSQLLTIPRILEGVRAKNLQATILFVDLTKTFDSIHRGKMDQILLSYGIPKETVAAIMILYRNTKVKVRSLDGDTDRLLQHRSWSTTRRHTCPIPLYVPRTSIDKIKEDGFELTKKRSRRYPAKTITDTDYADDIAILANALAQTETRLHSLERTARGIGLHINAHKTEYMCLNQTGDISTLGGSSLKLLDKFTYRGSSVSSTEKDIDTRLPKAWTTISRLSVIWESDLTDKMRRSFFQAAVLSILLYGCTTWTLTKRLRKSLMATTQECCEQFWTSPGGNTPKSSSCTATNLPSRKLSKLDEPDMQDTAGEAGTSSEVMFSYGPPHMAKQGQEDRLEPTYNYSVRTCQKRWTIGRSGERGSGISVLAARHDDDDLMESGFRHLDNLLNKQTNLNIERDL